MARTRYRSPLLPALCVAMYFNPKGFVELLERNEHRLGRCKLFASFVLVLSLILGHISGWTVGPFILTIYGFISLSLFVIISSLVFGESRSGPSIYRKVNQINRLYLLLVVQCLYLGSTLIVIGPIAWVLKVI